FLRSVRNDALLGPSEIIIEQILEPHARDKQKVPAILTPLHDIVNRPVRTNLAIILSSSVEVLVELLQKIHQLEMFWRLERIVILHQTKSHAKDSPKLRTRRIVNLGNILSQLIALKESSN